MGCVDHPKWNPCLLDAECLREDFGGETTPTHPQQHGLPESISLDGLREPVNIVDLIDDRRRKMEPAKAAVDLVRGRTPQCVVVIPDASRHIVLIQLEERFGEERAVSGKIRFQSNCHRIGFPQPFKLLAEAIRERVERSRKLGQALVEESVGYFLKIDAQLREPLKDVARSVCIEKKRPVGAAVIEDGMQCGDRYGVHRIWRDQRIHIHGVGVVGILRACTRPQRPLGRRTGFGQRFPARRGKHAVEHLVGKGGRSDRCLAEKLGRSEMLQLRVDGGVDPTDKERSDGRERRN